MAEPAPGFQKHPNYQVEITPTEDHVRIFLGEHCVADSRTPLKVTETKHHPVVPTSGGRGRRLHRSDRSLHLLPLQGVRQLLDGKHR